MVFADYGITAVKYNSEHTHIEKAEVRRISSDNTLGNPEYWPRINVVSEIELNRKFVTITLENNQWVAGQDIHIVKVNGVKYIRTDKDETASDNLENLPEYK